MSRRSFKVLVLGFRILACLGLPALLVSTAHGQRPPIPDLQHPVDYLGWLEARVRGGLPEDQNAAPLYEAAFGVTDGRFEQAPPDLGFAGFSMDKSLRWRLGPWVPDEHPDWEAAYQRTVAVRQTLMEAAELPYFWFAPQYGQKRTWPGKPLLIELVDPDPHFKQAIAGLLENAWRGETCVVPGDAILEAVKALLGISRQLIRDPRPLQQVHAMLARSSARTCLRAALCLGVLDSDHRQLALRLLIERDVAMELTENALYGDAMILYDAYQSLNTGPARPLINPFRSDKSLLGGLIRYPSAAPSTAVGLYMSVFEERLDHPYHPGLIRELTAARESLWLANEGCHMLLAPLGELHSLALRDEASRRGVRVIFLMQAFRDRLGRWPETLDELGPDARAFTADVFAPTPLGYCLVDGEPLLYSVGFDGTDNGGGKHDGRFGKDVPETDFVFLPEHD